MEQDVFLKLIKLRNKYDFETVYRVHGNSMNPIIQHGDIVVTKGNHNYNIGDVLVFYYKRYLTVHRLLKKVDNLFYIKGDNSFRLEIVTKNDILGKVIKVKRGGKNIKYVLPDNLIPLVVKYSLEVNEVLKKGNIKLDKIRSTESYFNLMQVLNSFVHDEISR